MSVLSAQRLWDDRSAALDKSATQTVTRSWLVKTDNKNDTDQDIKSSGLIPDLYDALPGNSALTVRQIAIRQKSESPFAWVVTCTYSNETDSEEIEQRVTALNPMDRRAKLSWSSNQYTLAIHKDINGNAILNSAGDYFIDPPPEIQVSRWTVTVTKNLLAIPAWLLLYQDAINSGPFVVGGLTVNAGCARLVGMQISDLQKENGFEFYPLSITMEFRKEGWKLKLLNQGYKQRGGASCVTKEGIPVTSPACLDASGMQIDPDDVDPETATYLDFDVYESLDFSVLPLA